MSDPHYVIRRPVGSKKYLYFHAHGDPDKWVDSVFNVITVWQSEEHAVGYMKTNKSHFGPDDEVSSKPDPYDGTFCPFCLRNSTLRVDGTERQPGDKAVFDMVCTNCNSKFQESYAWVGAASHKP